MQARPRGNLQMSSAAQTFEQLVTLRTTNRRLLLVFHETAIESRSMLLGFKNKKVNNRVWFGAFLIISFKQTSYRKHFWSVFTSPFHIWRWKIHPVFFADQLRFNLQTERRSWVWIPATASLHRVGDCFMLPNTWFFFVANFKHDFKWHSSIRARLVDCTGNSWQLERFFQLSSGSLQLLPSFH